MPDPELQAPLIQITGDATPTLHSVTYHSDYHSKYGALQESIHVFIRAGLRYSLQLNDTSPLRILEMGFGTGLNAWLTLVEAEANKRLVHYTAIEKHPISLDLASQLNYPLHFPTSFGTSFLELHTMSWFKLNPCTSHFSLEKWQGDLLDYTSPGEIDLIYFDAFGPEVQPELWHMDALGKLIDSLSRGGIFVTYSAKGEIRRRLQSLHLNVERLPGPPGKREILRAQKPL